MSGNVIQAPFYKSGLYYTGAGGGNTIIYREQIKDNFYHYVKIKDKFFTIESLKESFSGISNSNVLSSGNPCSFFLSENKVFGKYYNSPCLAIIDNWLENNSNGWRIPTKEDFENLFEYSVEDLQHAETWDNDGILNKTMFSAFKAGFFSENIYFDSDAYFLTKTKDDDKYYYLILTNSEIGIRNTFESKKRGFQIRLCKDA